MSAAVDTRIRGMRSAAAAPLRERAGALARSAVVWIVVAVIVLIAAIVLFLSRTPANEKALHYESVAPDGGMAFVEVLRGNGYSVTTTESREEAEEAVASGRGLLVYAADSTLPSETIADLRRAQAEGGAGIAVIDPQYAVADWTDALHYEPVDLSVAVSPGMRAPGCEAAVPRRAGSLYSESTGMEYFSSVSEPEGAAFCYGIASPDVMPHGLYAEVSDDDGRLTVIGEAGWLENDRLADDGNVSLIAGVVGAAGNDLVYYYPQRADQPDYGSSGADSAVSLVPAWGLALIAWTVVLSVVAMLVGGRRLGPLAFERLPVVVPALETVRGRAALMQRVGAREEALRDLRAAALLRLGRRYALGPEVPADAVCARTAEDIDADPQTVEAALLTDVPHTDAELLRIISEISSIESEAKTR